MQAAPLIAGLILQYGIPAVQAIADLVKKHKDAQSVPMEDWMKLRCSLAGLPEYEVVVGLRAGDQ